MRFMWRRDVDGGVELTLPRGLSGSVVVWEFPSWRRRLGLLLCLLRTGRIGVRFS